jgi:hypothetical protein
LALCIGLNFIREIVLVVKDREGIFWHVFGDILSFKFVCHLCIREIVLVVKDREEIFCHVFGDILSFKFVWHLCIREIVLEVKDREGYSVVLCVWQYSEL